MPTGYVALLDVLGFSALVTETDKTPRLEEYLQCLEEALGSGDSAVEYVVFSDTIVLTTDNNTDSAFLELLKRCSALLGTMLVKNIALRGAIAHGMFLRRTTPGGVFIAGRAVVDAYTFETKQDWVGIMLAPSAVKQNPNLAERLGLDNLWTEEALRSLGERLNIAAFLQPCSSIPFHADTTFEDYVFEGYAVVPTNGNSWPVTLRTSLQATLRSLQWLKSLAPDPRAQAKYSRCIHWLRAVEDKWRIVTQQFEQFNITRV